MTKSSGTKPSQWQSLARNDWGEILELSHKKVFQRKFQIVEVFKDLVARKASTESAIMSLQKNARYHGSFSNIIFQQESI